MWQSVSCHRNTARYVLKRTLSSTGNALDIVYDMFWAQRVRKQDVRFRIYTRIVVVPKALYRRDAIISLKLQTAPQKTGIRANRLLCMCVYEHVMVRASRTARLFVQNCWSAYLWDFVFAVYTKVEACIWLWLITIQNLIPRIWTTWMLKDQLSSENPRQVWGVGKLEW